ncbi:MAG TPA: hypothetical protein DEB09_02715 [Candidatus Magasanikbacteria bacterium]|nr:hypothetical protein [Candidatus Magasanikbacteria bacterium]
MKTPLYREAITHSWQLVWKHKMLWLFGLFAAFLGQMGLMDLLTKVSFASSKYTYPSWVSWPQVMQDLVSGMGFFSLSIDGWTWLVWLILILLGLCITTVVVAVVSQGALIDACAQSAKDKGLPSVSQAWHVGVKHFWPLFVLNLLKKIVMAGLAGAVGYSVLNFVLQSSGWGFLLFLVLFLLSVLVGLVLSFLVVYAAGYVVIEKYNFKEAVEAAWMLFIEHWLVSIEVGLLVLFLNILLGIVVFLGFWILFLPVAVVWFISVFTANSALWISGLLAGILIFLVFVVWVGSIFSAFVTSIWTYLFMKMHKHGIKSRLLHWSGHHRI